MKALMTAFLLLFPTGVAYADDECDRGNCGNEREENYEDAGCKYVCPSFKDSPVQDAFNIEPIICVMPDSCHFNEQPTEEAP